MPTILPAAIAAGASILGQGMNAFSQGSMNERTRRFANWQYDKQRADNLADWAMQNEYNHPSSQMARLRQAGLNPNLVYGNGANMPTAQIRSADNQQWNPRAPQFDPGSAAEQGLSAYYDTQMKDAQIDNFRVQNTVLAEEAALKKIAQLESVSRMGQMAVQTAKTKFELDLATDLKETSLQAARLGVDKIMADIDRTAAETQMTINENERRQVMQAPTIMKALEEILTMRAQRAHTNADRARILSQIKNIDNDTMLKQLDIQLKKDGIQPGDPAYMRILQQNLQKYGGLSGAVKKAWDAFNKPIDTNKVKPGSLQWRRNNP